MLEFSLFAFLANATAELLTWFSLRRSAVKDSIVVAISLALLSAKSFACLYQYMTPVKHNISWTLVEGITIKTNDNLVK